LAIAIQIAYATEIGLVPVAKYYFGSKGNLRNTSAATVLAIYERGF